MMRRLPVLVGVAILVLGACTSSGDGGGDASNGRDPGDATGDGGGSTDGDDAGPTDEARWSPVSTDGAPPATTDAVLVVAADGSLWLHGGRVEGEPVNDLWHFAGDAWEQVRSAGDAPDPRFDHVGVWDEARDRLVVATGQRTATELFDDVWAFDPEAAEWERLATGGPRARYGSCAVVDDDARMVISHGFSLEQRFGDTWGFDLETESWTEITPAAGPRPAARCLHACGWDSSAGELVLFGGRTDATAHMGDTWRLDGDGWRELGGEAPSPRVHSGGVLTDEGFLLVGGQGDDGLAGDAWLLAGDSWSAGPDGAPAARHSHAMAERDGVVWLFGGASEDGDLADLWRFGSAPGSST